MRQVENNWSRQRLNTLFFFSGKVINRNNINNHANLSWEDIGNLSSDI